MTVRSHNIQNIGRSSGDMISGNLLIICGHYGTGKTNLSVNLAIDSARSGKDVTLIDLDTVNPYFISSDHRDLLEQEGVKLISSEFANTNVESLSVPHIDLAFKSKGLTIIDVGGDDVGATVLGRYSQRITNMGYEMWYVINKYRPLISDHNETTEMLRNIESACRLKATGIVNNSHLKEFTTAETINSSTEYADRVSEDTKIPIVLTTHPKVITSGINKTDFLYAVDIYVRTPWDTRE